jgi:peptidoglycan hydrolase-like protein with peptidoglycan-binding domain
MAKKQNLPSLVTTKDGKTSGVDTNVTLRNGSTGVNVKSLQNALITAGYDVGAAGADGIYGNATAAAVRKYQQDNGLAVNGIAGKDTLGLLYSGTKPTTATGFSYSASTKPVTTGGNAKPTATTTTITGTVPSGSAKQSTGTQTNTPTTTPTTTSEPFTYEDFNYDKEFSYDDFSYGDFSYADYAESDIVKQANALLQQHLAGKPGDWVDPYLDQRMGYLDQYENRDPFSYDFNSDALYNQYKDQYIQQGRMAMMDTMGQAAAMTGGYGNSYAQTVGQQAYNQQLGQLNNIMPELYQMAYDRYNQQGRDLLNMYDLYAGLSEEDYGKYQDSMTNWYEQLGYLNDNYINERNFDYGKWSSDRSLAYDDYVADRNLAYNDYAADRALAWDKYVADRNLAHDDYVADRNLAYDQYQGEKDDAKWQADMDAQDSRWWATFEQDEKQNNYKNLADLITNTGYTPSASELAAAGMSESQAKALKDSYTALTSDPGVKYRDLSISDRAVLQKEIERVPDLPSLKSLVSQYIAMGYDPDLINAMTSEYAKRFLNGGSGNSGNTHVSPLGTNHYTR